MFTAEREKEGWISGGMQWPREQRKNWEDYIDILKGYKGLKDRFEKLDARVEGIWGKGRKEQKETEGYTNEWLNWRRQSEEEEREENKEERRRLGVECGGVEGC